MDCSYSLPVFVGTIRPRTATVTNDIKPATPCGKGNQVHFMLRDG